MRVAALGIGFAGKSYNVISINGLEQMIGFASAPGTRMRF
jgi:hypothetical protein